MANCNSLTHPNGGYASIEKGGACVHQVIEMTQQDVGREFDSRNFGVAEENQD
ncbi:hypothetical protein LPU83_pLPU83d_1640 (plasmid) [Rhizobium favelukesii]|uniref:Uncharacterized protein n=1 Tax=Rhizobium favelukesii TaxID=348824 RepID=W6RS97_9HYPH|nr:hypothetical protein LPU83_pLPU83d_1640 [Rhizobium favelukesii]